MLLKKNITYIRILLFVHYSFLVQNAIFIITLAIFIKMLIVALESKFTHCPIVSVECGFQPEDERGHFYYFWPFAGVASMPLAGNGDNHQSGENISEQ